MTEPIRPLTGRSRDFLELVLPAASTGKLAAVRAYLAAQPEFLRMIGPHGRTMLWEAARKGKLETVRFLLDAGADLEARGCYFRETSVEVSPWCIAKVRRKKAVADYLRAAGARYDLDSACFLGDRDRVEDLLTEDPTGIDRVFGDEREPADRAVHYAVAGGHLALVESLIDRGADVRSDGGRLVSWAMGSEDPELVRRLLEHGAVPRAGDVNEACLDPRWAALFGEFGFAGDINAPDRLGFPPLVEACRGNHNAREDVASIADLLARGARVDVRDHKGKTALHRAAQAGFCAIAALLVERGADLEAADAKGETPLFDAVRALRVEAVEFLLAAGADAAHRNRLGQDVAVLAGRSRKPRAGAVRALLER